MPERPTPDDVRAAVRAGADLGLTASNVTDAVMPFVDQSYEAGMAAVTEHLRQELAKVRAAMGEAEDAWRVTSPPDDHAAWLTYSYAQARYNAWRDAFSAAQSFSVGNSEKSTGVAGRERHHTWRGKRMADLDPYFHYA